MPKTPGNLNKITLPMKNGSVFILNSVSSSIRRGRINLNSAGEKKINIVSTPCLLVRTSRFLPAHLTPDNLDRTLPLDTSILEMNIDYIIENEAILENCSMSLAEFAGLPNRPVCLATRVFSEQETRPSTNIINGDDFVTVFNACGSKKFELKAMEGILNRFKPDIVIGPFDEHPIPISLKRCRKAVDRTLKYDKITAKACETLNIPLVSAVVGAEHKLEKERNITSSSNSGEGLAFCDLHKFSNFEDRLKMLKELDSCLTTVGGTRIIRGSVTPLEMIQLLPHADIFDTTHVDDLTTKGHALQIDFSDENAGESVELISRASTKSLDLWDEVHFNDFGPIMKSCGCHACKHYTRSYVHHLLKTHEMLASVLLMMHNLFQYHNWLEYLKQKLE